MRPLTLIAAAGLIGLVAGAVVLYVSGAPSGNMTGADAACAEKTAKAEAVAKAAVGDVAALLPAQPPTSLAGLAFDMPDGRPGRLADFSGKALLVNLWATWCVPCREEMPALDRLQQDRGDARFAVVAINLDRGDAAKPRAFLDEIKVGALALYRDPTLKLFNEAKQRGLALGLPVTLLIDSEGCLMAHMNGPADSAGPQALTVIDALTKG